VSCCAFPSSAQRVNVTGHTLWLTKGARGCACAGSSVAALWDAVGDGDVSAVKRLVGRDPGLLARRDEYGRTPLMLASHEGHIELAQRLVDSGAAINESDASGCTALWAASCNGRAPVVGLLLGRGADPAVADEEGWTPLLCAVTGGYLDVTRCLLDDPRADRFIDHRSKNGETALWLASSMGCADVVNMLLEAGADPTVAADDGTTALMIAMRCPPGGLFAGGRRECAVLLMVRRPFLPVLPSLAQGRSSDRDCGAFSSDVARTGGGAALVPPVEWKREFPAVERERECPRAASARPAGEWPVLDWGAGGGAKGGVEAARGLRLAPAQEGAPASQPGLPCAMRGRGGGGSPRRRSVPLD
jgi:ankyrin repeat protein